MDIDNFTAKFINDNKKKNWIKSMSDSNIQNISTNTEPCKLLDHDAPLPNQSKSLPNGKVAVNESKLNEVLVEEFDFNWSQSPTRSSSSKPQTTTSPQEDSVKSESTSLQYSDIGSQPNVTNVFLPQFVGNTELNFLGSGMVEVAPDIYLQSDYYLMTNIPALGTVVSPLYSPDQSSEIYQHVSRDNDNSTKYIYPNSQHDKNIFIEEAKNRIRCINSPNPQITELESEEMFSSSYLSQNLQSAPISEYMQENIRCPSTNISSSKYAIFPIEETQENSSEQFVETERNEGITYRLKNSHNNLQETYECDCEEYETETSVGKVSNPYFQTETYLPNQIIPKHADQQISIKEAIHLKNKYKSNNFHSVKDASCIDSAKVKNNQHSYAGTMSSTTKHPDHLLNIEEITEAIINQSDSSTKKHFSKSDSIEDFIKENESKTNGFFTEQDSSCFSMNCLLKLFKRKKPDTVVNVSKTYFMKLSNTKIRPREKNSKKNDILFRNRRCVPN